MKTKIPKDGWYKVGQEALAHLIHSLDLAGDESIDFYCGKISSQDLVKHDKNCFNRCWRCIEAYERAR